VSQNHANATDEMLVALSPYKIEGHEKTRWTEVGVAFRSKDGKGATLLIRPGLSVSGRIVLRPIELREKGSGDGLKSDQVPLSEGLDQGSERKGFAYYAAMENDLV